MSISHNGLTQELPADDVRVLPVANVEGGVVAAFEAATGAAGSANARRRSLRLPGIRMGKWLSTMRAESMSGLPSAAIGCCFLTRLA